MRPFRALGAAALLATTLTGCTGTGGVAAGTAAPGTPRATPSAITSATPAATDAGGAATTTLDPCQLVTQQEASVLTGASFGPGRPESDPGGAKRCVYGYQTRNVLTVVVAQAASKAEAQAEKDKVLADVEQDIAAKLNLTPVPNVGDDAEAIQAVLSAGGASVAVSGIYVLHDTVGFANVDATAAGPAPGRAALIGQANTVIGRLP